MFKNKEEQFDFYWKEIFDGLAYNPIEFNTYRFDQTMSLPGKVNKLYDMFKVLAMNNQEVMDYLKAFVETFDEKLYKTTSDVLSVWLKDGSLIELIRETINEEVVEARTNNKNTTFNSLKKHLDDTENVIDEINKRTNVIKFAYDFDILPDVEQSQEKLETYFKWCDDNKQSAKFAQGTYLIKCVELVLPRFGIIGLGRNETILKLLPLNDTDDLLLFGEQDKWNNLKGNIERIRFEVADDVPNTLLTINTPDRTVSIRDTIFRIGTGIGVNLIQTFYLNFDSVLFEGKYSQEFGTNVANSLRGVAINTPTNENVNNVNFNKCDFRYLSNCITSSNSVFTGSTNINFVNTAFEYIGNTVFVVNGFKMLFNACYFENYDRNKNVIEHPKFSRVIFLSGGGGDIKFISCVFNGQGVRTDNDVYWFSYIKGIIYLESCPASSMSNINLLKPATYSSQGVIVNDTDAFSEGYYAINPVNQDRTLLYNRNKNIFASQINENVYSKYSLSHFTNPTDVTYMPNKIQGIVQIDGISNENTYIAKISFRIYRLTKANTLAYVDFDVSFSVNDTTISNVIVDKTKHKDDYSLFATDIENYIKVAKLKTLSGFGYRVELYNQPQFTTGSYCVANVTTNLIPIVKTKPLTGIAITPILHTWGDESQEI